jgi:integrase
VTAGRRTPGRLSTARVRTAKPKAGRRALILADGGNLYLQATVGSGGNVHRSWTFRFELNGRRRELGLGPTYTISLSEARDRARTLRQQLLDGIDPLEQRRASKLSERAEAAKQVTFQDVTRMYFEAHENSWRSRKHAKEWLSSLDAYAHPIIGDLAVAAITTDLVLRAIEPIWATKGVTAGRVRGRIETVLDYAKVRGLRDGDNPARWRGHLDHLLPGRAKTKIKHLAALPYADVPQLMSEVRGRDGTAARALEFLTLTAARSGEVIGAQWSEIDLKTKTWVIPPERMKREREHRVPLSDRAVKILAGLPRTGDLAFPSARGGTLSKLAMWELLSKLRSDVTVHGLRSSFRDWAAETTNFANHVVEMALAHAIGDDVEASYRRGDLFEKRKLLMAEWDRFCTKPAPTGATVTRLRKARTDA